MEQIREHTYPSNSSLSSHFKDSPNEWNRLCAAMDVLEDTALALDNYEIQGIGNDDGEKYLRLYGILQAIVLQEDSIRHLYKIFTEQTLKPDMSTAWQKIREVRNLSVGHPVEADFNKKHCFISRVSINPSGFRMCFWDKENQENEFQDIGLQTLYEDYKSEAVTYLQFAYEEERSKWPALQ